MSCKEPRSAQLASMFTETCSSVMFAYSWSSGTSQVNFIPCVLLMGPYTVNCLEMRRAEGEREREGEEEEEITPESGSLVMFTSGGTGVQDEARVMAASASSNPNPNLSFHLMPAAFHPLKNLVVGGVGTG